MKTYLRLLPVACLVLLAGVTRCDAGQLKFTMVTDELLNGKAVLQGDLLGAPFHELTGLSLTAKRPDGTDPKNWTSTITLFKSGAGQFDVRRVNGRHISDPPPHKGEDTPGPPLRVGDLVSPFAFADLAAFKGAAPDPLKKQDKKLHDNPDHFDVMDVQLIDLDANSKSVLFGAFDEIRLTVTFHHTPEPSTLALAGTGFLSMVGFAWRRRRNQLEQEAPNIRKAGL